MQYDTKASGKRIKQLRQEMNLSQEQLAEKLNVSQNMIAKIEHVMQTFVQRGGAVLMTSHQTVAVANKQLDLTLYMV